MFSSRLKLLATCCTAALVLLATTAFARQGTVACAVVGLAGMHVLEDGSLTDSDSETDQRRYRQLVRAARARIEATFGTIESKPTLAFFNGAKGFGPFKLNPYGGTETIGSRACVMIGPKGQNVDVVAHELMHAELFHRVGFLRSLFQVPTWFDEGVAMQVDYRGRYLLSPEEVGNSDYVTALTTNSAFLDAEDKLLTRNYASAKAVIASWITRVGAASLYQRLNRLNDGEPFSEVVPAQEFTGRPAELPSTPAELRH